MYAVRECTRVASNLVLATEKETRGRGSLRTMRCIRWDRLASASGANLRVLPVLEIARTRILRSFRVKAIEDAVKTKVADAQKEMRRVVASTRG